MKNTNKKAFAAPTLTKYGKFEELTQGGGEGNALDVSFAVLTLKGDLTFS